MSEIIKNKNIIQKEPKYFYFIPCYDIINNEIYFFDFYTEKSVVKPKNLTKNQKKDIELKFSQSPTMYNLLEVGKSLKKEKDQLKGKRSKTKGIYSTSKENKKLNKDNKINKDD